ncbi:MAG: N-acetylmuramoyl-L-alanine amidase [Legionellales bacterium]|nr:N-acetylmuramoyl-L-alanine amidase [Legionellales bacterium]
MRVMQKIGFTLALCLVTFVGMAAQLNHITVLHQQPNLVLGFAMTGHAAHKIFTLHNPERIVIDLPNTTNQINPNFLEHTTQLIKTVRVGHPQPQTLRLVLETKQPVQFQSSNWENGWQLSITPSTASAHARAPKPSIPTHHSTNIISPPYAGNRDVIVVLDPGHGGHDPGAIGSKRTHEKEVVLAIAKKLKTLIDQQPGMRAVLTRNGDYYIGLRERMAIARRHNADLFIAIHADAFENHNSHGASVFALSQRGATSEAARWLAAKENYSELGGVNLSKLHDQNGMIRSVLIDLSQTATISASVQLGHQVLHGLNHITTLHSHKVEQARFMVLKSPDIPSVLIETGFISNQREEMNLTNPRYQTQLCQAIMGGIKTYFWEYPPHGSKIAAMAARYQTISHNNMGRANTRLG